MTQLYSLRTTCRSCGAPLETILQMGVFPLADRLLLTSDNSSEIKVPLSICFCNQCNLMQIAEDISPSMLFQDNYPYYSSQNPALKKHFSESANILCEKYNLSSKSWVLEVACNDGVMLETFHQKGIPCTGVDPAIGPAETAKSKGLDIINDFFDDLLAFKMLKKYNKKADLILCNNVLAHVPDPNLLLRGIHSILSDTGKVVIEVPYLLDLLEKVEFDTIFHQHYSYFSLTALQYLFEKNGLYINAIKRISIHGGSLRVFASKERRKEESILLLEQEEIDKGLMDINDYKEFIKNIHNLKNELLALLTHLKSEGKTIEGYGAAGKATTLTHFIGINNSLISYIADNNIHKQGKFFPGNALPIVSPEVILQNPPDYLIILAWNFANEIMEQLKDYHQLGGKFIIPVPTPIIV